MEEQIPDGPQDKFCPLFRKRASKVCRTCMWWARVRFEKPQEDGGQFFDQWACTQAITPGLIMDVGRQQRAAAASTQEMTKELKKGNAAAHASVVTLVSLVNRVMPMNDAAPMIETPAAATARALSDHTGVSKS